MAEQKKKYGAASVRTALYYARKKNKQKRQARLDEAPEDPPEDP